MKCFTHTLPSEGAHALVALVLYVMECDGWQASKLLVEACCVIEQFAINLRWRAAVPAAHMQHIICNKIWRFATEG
jgi:hypothetical protein